MKGLRYVIMAVALLGCSAAFGNGRSGTETRPTPAFDAILANTALPVTIVAGPTTSVVVTTDDNLLPLVRTTVTGSTLVIDQVASIQPRTASSVTVRVPTLASLEHDGSGSMSVSGFSVPTLHVVAGGSGRLDLDARADTLNVGAFGSGSVSLSGDAGALALLARGSGSVDASRLTTHGADASVQGSGSTRLLVSGDATLSDSGSGSIHAELDDGDASLSISGSGSIRWKGNSRVIAESRTGSGDIVHD